MSDRPRLTKPAPRQKMAAIRPTAAPRPKVQSRETFQGAILLILGLGAACVALYGLMGLYMVAHP